uniref:ShKT domain-containing protein n=1 Tax=Panagrellus redivivus TaxID=6233 RepID=A0A7E5A0E3_PANRE
MLFVSVIIIGLIARTHAQNMVGFCDGGFCPPDSTCAADGMCYTNPTNTDCADVAANCATLTAYCTNPIYYDLMTEKCPNTCNRCDSQGCANADAEAKCAVWVSNGFCTNAFYTDDQKREHCARSCGLC